MERMTLDDKSLFLEEFGQVGLEELRGGFGFKEEEEERESRTQERIGSLVQINAGEDATWFKDAVNFLENLTKLVSLHFMEGEAGVDEVELGIGKGHSLSPAFDEGGGWDILLGTLDRAGGSV
jgi:hypothetical protein